MYSKLINAVGPERYSGLLSDQVQPDEINRDTVLANQEILMFTSAIDKVVLKQLLSRSQGIAALPTVSLVSDTPFTGLRLRPTIN